MQILVAVIGAINDKEKEHTSKSCGALQLFILNTVLFSFANTKFKLGIMEVSSKSVYGAVSERETSAEGVRLGAHVLSFIHSDVIY